MLTREENLRFHLVGHNEMLKNFISGHLQGFFSCSEFTVVKQPDFLLRRRYQENEIVLCVYSSLNAKDIKQMIHIRKMIRPAKVILLTQDPSFFPPAFLQTLDVDAVYSINKNICGLTETILSVLRGNKYSYAEFRVPESPLLKLTSKELEVFIFLRTGMTNKEIANVSGKAESTVKAQLKSVYKKLGINNRWAALTSPSMEVFGPN